MPEQVIYESGNVKITTARIMISGTTYSLNNIASVYVSTEANKSAWILLIIAVLFITRTFFQSGIMGIFSFNMLLGIGLIALAFYIGFQINRLCLTTSSGNHVAYTGKISTVLMLKEKIEQAMVEKG